MAASYPSSLPVKDAAGATLATNPHSGLHDDMYDEIVAIATELGTAPKGTAASVKARLDALPLGKVGYAAVTASQGSITTNTFLTGLSVTWTATASRLYRTSFFIYNVSSSVNPQTLAVTINDGPGNTLTRTDHVTASAEPESLVASVVMSGLSGSATHRLRLLPITGGGTLTMSAAATNPAYILVEDIGAA